MFNEVEKDGGLDVINYTNSKNEIPQLSNETVFFKPLTLDTEIGWTGVLPTPRLLSVRVIVYIFILSTGDET